MRLLIFLFIFSSLSVSISALAEQNNTVGKDIYQQCIACHGAEGQGNKLLNSPRLAGQYESYLIRQLSHFKNKLRGDKTEDVQGKQMQAIAMSLSEQQIKQVSTYLSSLPQPKIESSIQGDVKNGNRYYQAKCGACHAGQGQGNSQFNAPNIANQHAEYLNRQIMHFKTGVRGYDKKDKYGRQMVMMANIINDKDWHDILYFLSLQPVPASK
jgi:cytochrome c oxidase subunit 2